MANNNIKFGTSGWRAVIAEDFNSLNVKRVSHAIAKHVKENKDYGFKGEEYLIDLKNNSRKKPKNPHVVIGFDTRYLSEQFAHEAAEAIADDNVTVSVSEEAAPIPALAWEVHRTSASGGLMIAAGNERSYKSGIKWIPFWGGPALSEITEDIEAKAQALTIADSEKGMPFEEAKETGMLKMSDFREPYFEQILSILDIKTIKKANLKIAVDPNHGAARNYMRPLLEQAGVKVTGIRENRDVLFDGVRPDTSPANMARVQEAVKKEKLNLGLVCNCDADRYGITDSDGKWIPPNLILGMILEHLVKNKGMKGKVARSVMTSHFVDSVAKFHGLEVRQTPVGFKHIGNLMRSGQYLIGGEESSGLTIMGHTPERDGILACLLATEMIAYKKKPLRKILEEMEKKYRKFYTERIDIDIPEDINLFDIAGKLENNPPLSLCGKSVWRIDNTDGFKFIMRDGTWLGLRPSGTAAKQIMRVYIEAFSQKDVEMLKEAGNNIAFGKF
ncbi:MAG: hypothetical protein J5706_03955 [Elusimicrobiales bacterium]|nr:hypothetical protein [Elusimicrobiales bacterium]